MQLNQLRKKSQSICEGRSTLVSSYGGKIISKKLESSKTNLPIQDDYDEMRRPRSKKYLATVRALRMNYDLLAEYEEQLNTLPQLPKDVNLESFHQDVRVIEIKEEIEQIVADIKQLEETLTQVMPKGDELIARLYMNVNQSTLLVRGIIPMPGVRYDTVEELCEGAYTEEEERALILGNVKLHSDPMPLVIEVYRHLVNRVNADGSVDVFEI